MRCPSLCCRSGLILHPWTVVTEGGSVGTLRRTTMYYVLPEETAGTTSTRRCGPDRDVGAVVLAVVCT